MDDRDRLSSSIALGPPSRSESEPGILTLLGPQRVLTPGAAFMPWRQGLSPRLEPSIRSNLRMPYPFHWRSHPRIAPHAIQRDGRCAGFAVSSSSCFSPLARSWYFRSA